MEVLFLLVLFLAAVGFIVNAIFSSINESREEKYQAERDRAAVVHNVNEIKRVLGSSLEIVNNSKNIRTRLGRIQDCLKFADNLKEYEHLSYVQLQAPTDDLKKDLKSLNDEIIEEEIQSLIEKAKIKVEHAKTLSAKTNPLARVLEKIEEYKDDLFEKNRLDHAVYKIREVIQFVEVDDYLTKAEKLMFKKEYKKALSVYQDALFFLKSDSTYQPLKDKYMEEVEARIKSIPND